MIQLIKQSAKQSIGETINISDMILLIDDSYDLINDLIMQSHNEQHSNKLIGHLFCLHFIKQKGKQNLGAIKSKVLYLNFARLSSLPVYVCSCANFQASSTYGSENKEVSPKVSKNLVCTGLTQTWFYAALK